MLCPNALIRLVVPAYGLYIDTRIHHTHDSTSWGTCCARVYISISYWSQFMRETRTCLSDPYTLACANVQILLHYFHKHVRPKYLISSRNISCLLANISFHVSHFICPNPNVLMYVCACVCVCVLRVIFCAHTHTHIVGRGHGAANPWGVARQIRVPKGPPLPPLPPTLRTHHIDAHTHTHTHQHTGSVGHQNRHDRQRHAKTFRHQGAIYIYMYNLYIICILYNITYMINRYYIYITYICNHKKKSQLMRCSTLKMQLPSPAD